jgi:threonine aldolase
MKLVPAQVDTNIVIFEIEPRLGTAPEFCKKLGEQGVGMFPFGRQRVRAVTHLDVTTEQITQAAEILLELSE